MRVLRELHFVVELRLPHVELGFSNRLSSLEFGAVGIGFRTCGTSPRSVQVQALHLYILSLTPKVCKILAVYGCCYAFRANILHTFWA